MITKRPRWWQTIRARLTLVLAATFLLMGSAVVALNYIQLTQYLDRQLVFRTQFIRPPGPVASTTATSPPPLSTQEQNSRADIQSQTDRTRRNTAHRMLLSSISLLLLGGLMVTALGWLLAGQALQPLRAITATARRVNDRQLNERIDLTGPLDETKDLADAMDSMFQRLDQSFESQQRFIANASHELRTPLAINRTLIEVALLEDPHPGERLRHFAATLLAVNHRHERLIDGLLTLTSSEQRVGDPTPVDMAEVAAHVAGQLLERVEGSRIDLRTTLLAAPVLGDPILLERLTENLLQNAARYNVPDGAWISVSSGVTGNHAELVVENPGPVVPAYDLPRMFEPFQRLRSERLADATGISVRRGVGLGLSIVRSVARAHGGDVTAVPRDQGGLIVRVSIPRHTVPAGTNPKAG